MTCTRALFAGHKLRCTRQRAAVYEALRACKSHPTAETLYKLVQQQVEGISLATVYNTLEVLCRVGLVRKLPTAAGCCRFEADMGEHLHVRFTDSNEIADVPHELGSALLENLPSEVMERIEAEMGIRIEGVAIQLIARGEAAPQAVEVARTPPNGWAAELRRESA